MSNSKITFKKINESASYDEYKKQMELKSPGQPNENPTVTGKAIEVAKTDTPKEEKDHNSYKKPTEPYGIEHFQKIVSDILTGKPVEVKETPDSAKLELEKNITGKGKVNESVAGDDLASVIATLKQENPNLDNKQLLAKALELENAK